ncbi:pentapeptide repeat-containing protein [Paracoccus laeviglucosivorans]|uniref:Pentapeptide repeat-containing protein n=1 Tax=Paracoccus laeviglucosivorans TaxID=1197861 RepID=A0A521C223_9RHOB|nr:pentapeptide repeat-containing protein [Paracoccus laeviglucosivorans]SMO53385.1 Pentapeptide repeat-containing protein [Paracoccus laeviglucosivorans]
MGRHTREEILRKIVTSGQVQMPHADLSGLNLSGLTLVGADLSYANLTGTDLRDAQLVGASLWSSTARGARFRGANLNGANLGLAVLVGADLRDTQLRDADLTGAQLDGADLTGAEMRGSWLDAMQRALAIGAPPMRFPEASHPRTRVLHQADLEGAVTLRSGDRLELRLDHPPRRTRIRQADAKAQAVLIGPDRSTADQPRHNVSFTAGAPGRANLRIGFGQGLLPLVLDILVST